MNKEIFFVLLPYLDLGAGENPVRSRGLNRALQITDQNKDQEHELRRDYCSDRAEPKGSQQAQIIISSCLL